MHVHLQWRKRRAGSGRHQRPLPLRVEGHLSPRRKAKPILLNATGVDSVLLSMPGGARPDHVVDLSDSAQWSYGSRGQSRSVFARSSAGASAASTSLTSASVEPSGAADRSRSTFDRTG